MTEWFLLKNADAATRWPQPANGSWNPPFWGFSQSNKNRSHKFRSGLYGLCHKVWIRRSVKNCVVGRDLWEQELSICQQISDSLMDEIETFATCHQFFGRIEWKPLNPPSFLETITRFIRGSLRFVFSFTLTSTRVCCYHRNRILFYLLSRRNIFKNHVATDQS